MANTPSAQTVKLLSPFNGEVITFTFAPGQVPTLETMLDAMLAAKFVRLDQPKNKPLKQQQKETRDGASETAQQERESGRD